MAAGLALLKQVYRRTRRGIAAAPWLSRKRCIACDRPIGRFLPYRAGARGLPKLASWRSFSRNCAALGAV